MKVAAVNVRRARRSRALCRRPPRTAARPSGRPRHRSPGSGGGRAATARRAGGRPARSRRTDQWLPARAPPGRIPSSDVFDVFSAQLSTDTRVSLQPCIRVTDTHTQGLFLRIFTYYPKYVEKFISMIFICTTILSPSHSRSIKQIIVRYF